MRCEGRVMSGLHNDRKFIESYALHVNDCFPVSAGIDRKICLAYALGDAWSVGNIADILDYRPWIEISDSDFFRCGFSELESYLTKEAFAYYIPAFLISAVRNIGSDMTRLHEVLLHMVLPYDCRFSELWDAFGDGLFDMPLDANALNSIERCKYLHEHLSARQRKCVAIFVGNILNYFKISSNSHFALLKSRFIGFWAGMDY